MALRNLMELGIVLTFGYSASGGLAQAFIQAYPERVEHLILSRCTPLHPDAAHRLDRMAGLLKLPPLLSVIGADSSSILFV